MTGSSQLECKTGKEKLPKKLANSAHRYKRSELFVFSHFQLDVLVACFLLQAVFGVRLECLVKLSKHKAIQ